GAHHRGEADEAARQVRVAPGRIARVSLRVPSAPAGVPRGKPHEEESTTLFTGSLCMEKPAELSATTLSTGNCFVVCAGLSQSMRIRQDSRQGLSSQKRTSSAPAAPFRNDAGSGD